MNYFFKIKLNFLKILRYKECQKIVNINHLKHRNLLLDIQDINIYFYLPEVVY